VRVSQCEDFAAALKAGEWLAEYAERLMKSERRGKSGRGVWGFAGRERAMAGLLMHALLG
jgi:hypothetical protein